MQIKPLLLEIIDFSVEGRPLLTTFIATCIVPLFTGHILMTEENPLVIAQWMQPDYFFAATQQQKLTRLMAEWRTHRDQGQSLAPDTQQELEAVVEAELLASVARTSAMLDGLTP